MKKNENREKFGQRLKKLRNNNDFTQQQVADALKIDRSTYSYYETGKTEPNYESTLKLAKIFGVTVQELLTGEIPKSSGVSEPPPFNLPTTLNDNLSNDEKFLIINFRTLPKEQQRKILEGIINNENTINNENSDKTQKNNF